MKKFYFKSFITALLLLYSTVASAHDFEVDGIYYNITYSSAKTVAVTYKGSYSSDFYDEYSGNITIPASITYYGTTYSVTHIGSDAFYGCSGLASVTIPNSVTSIGSNAFYYCTGLTSITIPNSVTSIGSFAFSGCTGLRIVYNNSSLNITTGSPNHGYVAYFADIIVTKDDDIQGDYIFRTADNTNTLIAYTGNDSVITLPENYNDENYTIGENAFRNCTGLTSVTIPNSVTSIGDWAFAHCSGLTSVTIPNSVTSIGDWAFAHCSGLTSVTIPNSVTSIGNYAFVHCSGLTSVTIPNSVTSIESSAFYGCTGLYSVTIPKSVEEIEVNAFEGCTGITEIYSMAEVPAVITETSFPNYSATLYVPYGAKRIYKITDGWSNFTNIVEMEPIEDPEEERLVGDVDGDGSIDIADVTALVEIILGTKQ